MSGHLHYILRRCNCDIRTDTSSTLQTLSAYLDSVRTVLALILQIPPIDPSTSLRIAYLLRFTSDVLGAIPGYNISSSSGLPSHAVLQDVVDFLDDLDQSWMAVIQNQIWDPDRAEGVDLVIPTTSNELANNSFINYRSSPPSQTDVTRLRSLLFSGQSALEEWVSNQRNKGDKEEEDVAMMLANMGLLDQFDSLFAQTLDYLGGFSGDVARNVVEPELEVEMGCA